MDQHAVLVKYSPAMCPVSASLLRGNKYLLGCVVVFVDTSLLACVLLTYITYIAFPRDIDPNSATDFDDSVGKIGPYVKGEKPTAKYLLIALSRFARRVKYAAFSGHQS